MIILYSVLTIGVMGVIAGCVLAYASKKFFVPVDPTVEELTRALPGANCGACGYAKCAELAKAIIAGKKSANGCVVGGADTAEKVKEVMDKFGLHPSSGAESPDAVVKKVAFVRCRGGKNKAKEKFAYTGVEACAASVLMAGGHKACGYGCLGFGDCVAACLFDAVFMGPDGIPVIDETKCTACGKCVTVCPRNIIELIPREQQVVLACVSHDKLKKVKDVCQVGCITCGICVKPDVAPSEAITMGDNIPVIHWEKGRDLRGILSRAVEKCPNKCFVVRE